MKTATTFKSITVVALLGAALAMPVMAQQGGGMGGGKGGGMGAGPGMQNGTPAAGMGQGGGMGGGTGKAGRMGGRGGMRFSQNNMAGWTLMTPAERSEQQNKMRTANSYAECKQIQAEHRVTMEARAKEKGATLPAPRQNGCDRMQAMSFFK
ncbi:MAG: hypothetical protein WBN04_18945 [Paracoccaceae bacterium]